MRYIQRTLIGAILIWSADCSSVAHAQGNVVMALDGMIVNNQGGGQPSWGGFGRFNYGDNTIGTSTRPGIGRYDAFTLNHTGTSGSGVGINFTIGNINSPVDPFLGPIEPVTNNMFPLLDLATFGANFDPSQYVAELIYRPLPGNEATTLSITIDTTDGFTDEGLRAGEQWQWTFNDLVNQFNTAEMNGQLDAQGYLTVRNNMGVMSQAAASFNGPSFMYTQAPLPTTQRDMMADFNDFEGGPLEVPNGVVQIHLQTSYDGTLGPPVDNWEVKALRIVKLDPDPTEVARLDGKSGFSQRFNSPFARNTDTGIVIDGFEYFPDNTDQLQRFDQNGFLANNAFRINTDDDDAFGGFGIWQSGVSTVFDGNEAMLEVRAKLTAPLAEQAPSIRVIAKDRDGNGTAEMGDFGGEEYHFNVALDQFNETTMTTISLPFSAAMVEQAQEFATPGDGMLSDFNLYYLGMLTEQDAGLVDLEVEYVRIVVSPPPGLPGDFSGNGSVENADLTLLLDNWGQPVPPIPAGWVGAAPTSPAIDNDELTALLDNWGASVGSAAAYSGAAVPEAGAFVYLAAAAVGAMSLRRRPQNPRES